MPPPTTTSTVASKPSPLDTTSLRDRLVGKFGTLLDDKIAQLQEDDVDAVTRSELANPYLAYQNDPLGFCRDVLHAKFTPDIEQLVLAVLHHPITQAISANAVGKTHAAAHIIIWFYMCHPFAQVYTFAAPPEDNLKLLLWGEIDALVERNPDLFTQERTNRNGRLTTMHIQRRSRVFITGVTIPATGTPAQREARFSGKHAPWMLFAGDEADACPIEVFRGIETCVSGGDTRQLYLFNPRAAEGPMYDMERTHATHIVHLSAFNHPNVVNGPTSGKDTSGNTIVIEQIPGAVSREKTVKRVNDYCRPLGPTEVPDKDCFLLPEFLNHTQARNAQEDLYPPLKPGHYRVINPAFNYIVLGRYPTVVENQLISPVWVERAVANGRAYAARHDTYPPPPPPGVRPIAGQDVGELGVDLSALALRYEYWIPPVVTWGGVDPLVTAENADRILKPLNPRTVNVDATGVGASVAPSLSRKGYTANRVMMSSRPAESNNTEEGTFDLVRDWIHWRFREWLRTNINACLPDDEELIEEILKLKYAVVRGRVVITPKEELRKLLHRSPDRLDAICLTFYDEELKSGTVVVTNYRSGTPGYRKSVKLRKSKKPRVAGHST